jgi:TatD DNase family protein
MVVDTHLHLTDERLAPEAADIVQRAREAGVAWMVTVATHLDDVESVLALASSLEGVYATVGIHPHSASTFDERSIDRLAELARHPKVVAIGETGLDFFYDNSPRDAQRLSFLRQLELAREMDLPVVVHSRDADDELREMITGVGWNRGVLHCFSGGRELMDDALALGWYISFAGMITFPKWDSTELLRAVPLDRLLVETDSPYLAPVPHRGKRNEPAFVRLIASRAAEIRGEDPEEVALATTRNASGFYRVSEDGAA